MNSSLVGKLAPLSGIIMVVLWLAGIVLIPGGFSYTLTPDQAWQAFSANPGRVQAGALLAGWYSVVFFIAFAGSVFDALRRAEAKEGPFAAIGFGGAVVSAFAFAAANGLLWMAGNRAGRPGGVSVEYAVVMNDLYSALLANVLSVGLAAFLGGSGIAALRTRTFPAWLGWVSVVFGVGLLSPIHWIFEGLFTIWVIVVSLLIYKRNQGFEREPTRVMEER
ncbi:MAG: hypothetical protein R3300_20140 [Candidatus Promineifilaceae bacterium]|nr:hypothetical protein [Candidatus Promineifilaceae bacterium]